MEKLALGSLPLQCQVFHEKLSFVLRTKRVAHIIEPLLRTYHFVWWPASKIVPDGQPQRQSLMALLPVTHILG